MTQFNRDNFEYSGGYLMFEGDATTQNEYYDHSERVHPTRRGTRKALFVARFKYGQSDKARFLTFLIKNFTAEEYFAKMNAGFSPAKILEAKGYVSATVRKSMKFHGYKVFTTQTYRQYFSDHMRTTTRDENYDCAEFYAKCDAEFAAINAVAA